jgi:hypothetical protein
MTTGGHSRTTVPRATCGDAEGLSTHEAAEITGTGQAAFKSRLHQARLRVQAVTGDQALVTARRMSRLAGHRPRARGGTQTGRQTRRDATGRAPGEGVLRGTP